MKILFWSECFWPHIGGIEVVSEQLMDLLQKRGFQFAVITSTYKDSPEEEVWKNIPIFRLPLRQGLRGDLSLFTGVLKRIIEIKKNFRPDIYHLNISGPSFFYHLHSLASFPAPTVFTFHYLVPPSTQKNGLLASMLGKSAWIVGASRNALEYARAFLPSITPRSSLIYNGLQSPPMEATPLSEKATSLLSWGRLVQSKGFELMLQAFALIKDRYPYLNYILIGDGPDKPRLKNLIRDLDLEDKVQLPGYHCSKEELFRAIDNARLVVIPSHDPAESFGLSALEAMQMARPVITTRHPGLNEVVTERQTGLLFEMNQVESLVSALEQLLSNFPLSRHYGFIGKERADTLFTLERMANEYESLFRSL